MCVPGVHAHATVGTSAISATAPTASSSRRPTSLLLLVARIVVGGITFVVVAVVVAAIVERRLDLRRSRRAAGRRGLVCPRLAAPPATVSEFLRAPRDPIHRHAAHFHHRFRAAMHLAQQVVEVVPPPPEVRDAAI